MKGEPVAVLKQESPSPKIKNREEKMFLGELMPTRSQRTQRLQAGLQAFASPQCTLPGAKGSKLNILY